MAFSDLFLEHYGLFSCVMLAMAAVLVTFGVVLVFWCRERVCFPRHHTEAGQRRGFGSEVVSRMRDDVFLEIQMEGQVSAEIQRIQMDQVYKTRTIFYTTYLEPYSMVVNQSHLYFEESEADGSPEEGNRDIGEGKETSRPSHLRLLGRRGGEPRLAEASCIICLQDYAPGDVIVWSSVDQCKHVFHRSCILTWLSKGTKRCPICRNWFVPDTKVDQHTLDIVSDQA